MVPNNGWIVNAPPPADQPVLRIQASIVEVIDQMREAPHASREDWDKWFAAHGDLISPPPAAVEPGGTTIRPEPELNVTFDRLQARGENKTLTVGDIRALGHQQDEAQILLNNMSAGMANLSAAVGDTVIFALQLIPGGSIGYAIAKTVNGQPLSWWDAPGIVLDSVQVVKLGAAGIKFIPKTVGLRGRPSNAAIISDVAKYLKGAGEAAKAFAETALTGNFLSQLSRWTLRVDDADKMSSQLLRLIRRWSNDPDRGTLRIGQAAYDEVITRVSGGSRDEILTILANRNLIEVIPDLPRIGKTIGTASRSTRALEISSSGGMGTFFEEVSHFSDVRMLEDVASGRKLSGEVVAEMYRLGERAGLSREQIEPLHRAFILALGATKSLLNGKLWGNTKSLPRAEEVALHQFIEGMNSLRMFQWFDDALNKSLF